MDKWLVRLSPAAQRKLVDGLPVFMWGVGRAYGVELPSTPRDAQTVNSRREVD